MVKAQGFIRQPQTKCQYVGEFIPGIHTDGINGQLLESIDRGIRCQARRFRK
jgi:hypothetical protein